VRREGRDLTIISYAAMLHVSLDAAIELAKEGIEAEVIDLRTLLPLDHETLLASVRKTNKLLVVHEDTRTGGIAGEIAGHRHGRSLRGPRRPGPPRDFARHAGPIRARARRVFSAQRGESCRRSSGTGAVLGEVTGN